MRPLDADSLRARLAKWGEHPNRITALLSDKGRDPGQVCWDVLQPTGLLDSDSPAELDASLYEHLTPETAILWLAATLNAELGWGLPGVSNRSLALAEDVVELLGPHAQWRSNGDYWVPLPEEPKRLPAPELRGTLNLTNGGFWRSVTYIWTSRLLSSVSVQATAW